MFDEVKTYEKCANFSGPPCICIHAGAVAGIAVGTFLCGALLSSIISIVFYSRWYVLCSFICIYRIMPSQIEH